MPKRMRWQPGGYLIYGRAPSAIEDLFYTAQGAGGTTWFHGYATEYDDLGVARRVAERLKDEEGWGMLQIITRNRSGSLRASLELSD